jgi:hypothetical protein
MALVYRPEGGPIGNAGPFLTASSVLQFGVGDDFPVLRHVFRFRTHLRVTSILSMAPSKVKGQRS